MSNIKKYCIYTTLYSIGFTFSTGAIMQAFLLQVGFDENQVYVLNSVMQIMQVVMMLIFPDKKVKISIITTCIICITEFKT